jgi:hypothetical protein
VAGARASVLSALVDVRGGVSQGAPARAYTFVCGVVCWYRFPASVVESASLTRLETRTKESNVCASGRYV